jgi:N-glycosylase/DNA lyase
VETARAIEDQGGIEVFREKLEEAEQPVQVLMGLSGVGPKVAGCIALCGAGRWDAFPIDVWMRRVMHRLYGIDEKDTRKMEEYANVNFAPYGGLAQQYLFYYIRGLEQARAEGGAEGEPEGPEGV